MKDIITFTLNDSEHDHELKTLQELLKDTGIEANINHYTAGNKRYSVLYISYDTEVINIKRKRNAGRPYIGHLGRYTIDNIKKMQESMTNKEIASILGISERTFYRRLKENSMSQENEEFL